MKVYNPEPVNHIVIEDEATPTEPEISDELLVHPFEDKAIQGLIKQLAPELLDKFLSDKVLKPKLSHNPDDLEKFEAGRQIKRKQRQTIIEGYKESDFAWLLRVLYEEMFLVNTTPGETAGIYKASMGYTSGGLLTHQYMNFTMDGVGFLSAREMDIHPSGIEATLNQLSDYQLKRKFIVYICSVTAPDLLDYMQSNWRRNQQALLEKQFVPNTGGHKLDSSGIDVDDLTTIGFRVARIIHDIPEMTENIQDQKLLDLVGYERSISKVDFWYALWSHFGTPKGGVLEQNGTYKSEYDPHTVEGLKQLLWIRSHPELQIFFKYFSPSGYLNEQ